MAKLNALDIYAVDELFTDEERLIRETVLDWVKERFLPLIEEHYEAGTFPLELVPELAQLGVFGATLPEKYGCAGVSHTAYGLINQALEYGDSGLRSFVSVQSGLVMYPIYAFGSEEQREQWLPRLARGEAIGCFGLTEPNHGSNPGGMETRAVKVEGGWLLNGAKAWITNGDLADVAVVWAKTTDAGAGRDRPYAQQRSIEGDGLIDPHAESRGSSPAPANDPEDSSDSSTIRGFLVERGMPGYATAEYKRKLSLRASVTSELYFKDVFVPDANMLPGVSGLRGPLSCLNQARYGIAWGATGAHMYCLEAALRYAGERRQFGRPIAGHQLQQKKLSEMATALTRAQLLCWRLGQLKQADTDARKGVPASVQADASGPARDSGGQGRPPSQGDKALPARISLAKRDNVWQAREAARQAREIMGGMGIMLESHVMRHSNNLESVLTYEGTHDVHLLILGEALTGESAFGG